MAFTQLDACVLGAKLRTVMSSIIRWRKGDTLRTAGIVYPKGVVWLLMASNDNSTADPRQSRNLVYPSNVLNNVAAIKLPRSGLVQIEKCGAPHFLDHAGKPSSNSLQ